MASPSKTPIVLLCSDGEVFEMEEAVAQQSEIIKAMIECDYPKKRIPIPNVTGNILSKVYEYCRKHHNTADDDEALISFDKEFLNVDVATLDHLATASRFLDIKSLSSLLWDAILKKKSKRKSIRELHRRVTEVRPSIWLPF